MKLPWLGRHHANAAVYLGVSLLSKGVSILLIPIYTSRLSRVEYGDYGLCQTLYWILPSLLSLGLSAAVSRFFFDYRDPVERDRMVGGLSAALIALSFAGALALEAVVDLVPGVRLGDLQRGHLRVVLWTCACIPLNEIPAIYFRASERAARFAAFHLAVFAVVAATTVYLMVVRGLGLYGLLGGMLVGQVCGAAFTLVFVFAGLRPRRDDKLLREAVRYSLPFIPHMIGNSLMVGADRWALESYGFKDALGLYTLATQLTLPVTLATGAWNEASSPRFFAAWRDGGVEAARRALPRVVLGFALCGGAALAAVLLGMPLLRYFVGPRFQPAFPLIPWIGMGLVVGAFFSAFVNALMLRKTTRIVPVLTMTSVAVNVGLNFVLVPRFAVYGAIAATSLAYAFRSALLLGFARRALRE